MLYLLVTIAFGLAPWPLEHSGLAEPGGARVKLRGGQVLRLRGAVEEALGCTSEDGTGKVYDLAADPAGLTFVAAENGLFVLGPRVAHLDPVWRREGAPAGTPRSVYVDERRRVWLATDEGVGPIDPSFGWGRTLGPEVLATETGEALRPPFSLEESTGEDPEGYAAQYAGRLRILGENGECLYSPDAAPRPRVEGLAINGAEVLPNDRLDVRYGAAQQLEPTGAAAGDATFRFRVDGHHVWRDVGTAGTLASLNPGEHLIEVVACDRDLNLSEPFPVRIRVAMPFYYGKAFVLGVGTVAGLLVAALSFAFQRPGTTLPHRLLASFATTGVILVFGLQIVAGLVPHAKGWPFVGYSMYTKSFRPEFPVHRPVLIACSSEGVEREIPPWALGYPIDGRWQVLGPIVTGDEAVAHDALQRVRERVAGPDQVVLQVQSRRFRLTEEGPTPIAPLVLSHYRWKEH